MNRVISHPLGTYFLLSICYGLITWHVWAHRSVIFAACGTITRLLCKAVLQPGGQAAVESRMKDLRIKTFHILISWLFHIYVAVLTVLVLMATFFVGSLSTGFFSHLVACILLYILCAGIHKGVVSITIHSLNVLFAGLMLLTICKIAVTDDEDYFLSAGIRSMFRLALAVFYLDVHKVIFWNILMSTASCLRFWHSTSVLWTGSSEFYLMMSFVILELSTVTMIVTGCLLVRQLHKRCLSAQLEAEVAHTAVSKILSVLCDAVVHLGPSGEILKSSPQMQHLVGSGSERSLEGTPLVDLLSSDSDRSRFQELIQAPVKLDIVTALHVNLNHQAEPVMCFHTHVPDLTGRPGHLVGLRQTGVVDTPTLTSGGLPVVPRGSQSQKTASRSSKSLSSRSSDRAPLVLPSWPEISLSVNVFSKELNVRDCTFHYVSAAMDDADAGWPVTLKNCALDCDWQNLHKFLYTRVNELYEDPDADLPSYKSLSLHLPLIDGDRSGTVEFHAGEVRVEFPEEEQELADSQYLWMKVRLLELSQVVMPSKRRQRRVAGLPVVAERQNSP